MGDTNERRKLDIDMVPTHIQERVYTDIGSASMCLEHAEKAGIFDTIESLRIAKELCLFIFEQINEGKKLKAVIIKEDTVGNEES